MADKHGRDIFSRAITKRRVLLGSSKSLSLVAVFLVSCGWDASLRAQPGDGDGMRRGLCSARKKSPLTQSDTLVLAFRTLNYTRINLGLGEKPHRLASAPDPPHHDQEQTFVTWFFLFLILPWTLNSPLPHPPSFCRVPGTQNGLSAFSAEPTRNLCKLEKGVVVGVWSLPSPKALGLGD